MVFYVRTRAGFQPQRQHAERLLQSRTGAGFQNTCVRQVQEIKTLSDRAGLVSVIHVSESTIDILALEGCFSSGLELDFRTPVKVEAWRLRYYLCHGVKHSYTERLL